jgi:hypothetical protein
MVRCFSFLTKNRGHKSSHKQYFKAEALKSENQEWRQHNAHKCKHASLKMIQNAIVPNSCVTCTASARVQLVGYPKPKDAALSETVANAMTTEA